MFVNFNHRDQFSLLERRENQQKSSRPKETGPDNGDIRDQPASPQSIRYDPTTGSSCRQPPVMMDILRQLLELLQRVLGSVKTPPSTTNGTGEGGSGSGKPEHGSCAPFLGPIRLHPKLKLINVIGLPLAQAEELAKSQGMRIRVTERDGIPEGITYDLRFNRINVAVKDGIIISRSADG